MAWYKEISSGVNRFYHSVGPCNGSEFLEIRCDIVVESYYITHEYFVRVDKPYWMTLSNYIEMNIPSDDERDIIYYIFKSLEYIR